MTDRLVIQCNYVEGTKITPAGARAYLSLTNPGNAHDRIMVLVRSRGARWVRKWENTARLVDFRVKVLPPEHPLYDHRDLYPPREYADDREWMEQLVVELNAAHAREGA